MVVRLDHARDGGCARDVDGDRTHLAANVGGQPTRHGVAALDVRPEEDVALAVADEDLTAENVVEVGLGEGLPAQSGLGDCEDAEVALGDDRAAGHVLVEAEHVDGAVGRVETVGQLLELVRLGRKVRARQKRREKAEEDGDEENDLVFHAHSLP